MSFTSEQERLVPAIDTILRGIDDFDTAVKARLVSGEWTDDHLFEVDNLRIRLNSFERELIKLKRSTR